MHLSVRSRRPLRLFMHGFLSAHLPHHPTTLQLKCKHCQLVADDSATRPLDAEVAAHATQDHKPQLEMPKEEDLNNWSHHFSTDTIKDPYLKKATLGTDLVSFVFGLEVSGDLTQKQTQIDLDRELDRAEGKKLQLVEARQRDEARKGKKGRKRKVSDDTSEVVLEADGKEASTSARDENGEVMHFTELIATIAQMNCNVLIN